MPRSRISDARHGSFQWPQEHEEDQCHPQGKQRAGATRTESGTTWSQSMPITVSLLPIAVATNQPPIISPRIRGWRNFRHEREAHRAEHQLAERDHDNRRR